MSMHSGEVSANQTDLQDFPEYSRVFKNAVKAIWKNTTLISQRRDNIFCPHYSIAQSPILSVIRYIQCKYK